MEFSLDHLRPEQRAVVTRLEVAPVLRYRLKAFGLIPNTRVLCCYRSPDGSVMSLECRGCVIAMRAKDLQNVWGRCQ